MPLHRDIYHKYECLPDLVELNWPIAKELGVPVYYYFVLKMLEECECEISEDNIYGFLHLMGKSFRSRIIDSLNR